MTGLDLAPALIETARERAREQDLEIDYKFASAIRPPLRVTRASSRAAASWSGENMTPTVDEALSNDASSNVIDSQSPTRTPEGGLGRMFAMMAPFQAAKPPSSPFEWGREEHVRELLGDTFELEIEEHVSTLTLASGEEYWQLFSTSYGPTKTLADSLDDERREEFHRTWVDFFDSEYMSNGNIEHTREYLLVLGTRR